MKAQYLNKVLTSVLAYIDHKILVRGEAFTNFSSNFYATNNLYNGYQTFACPFKQLVSDASVTGNFTPPVIPSGLYINGTFTPVGTSNLVGINHFDGQAYFSSAPAGTVSGNYSIKDFNVYTTEQTEEQILFETKYQTRPKTQQTLAALAPNQITAPAIFVKVQGGLNEPFGLGGIDRCITDIRAVVLADSSYKLDAVCNILNNTCRETVPFVDDLLPFKALGMTGAALYNYNNIATGLGMFIDEVNYVKIVKTNKSDYKDLNPDFFAAFVDFKLETYQNPRL